MIKYGPSTKCSGRTAAIRGGPRVQHSQECRERFEMLFRDDGDKRVERRTERMLRDIEHEEEEGMADEIPEMQESDEEKESEKEMILTQMMRKKKKYKT